MDEARTDDVAEVIQARRFELLDEEGRVRAVLGDARDGDSYAPTLELRDADGRLRSWYALFSFGPTLQFEVGSNTVLAIGVIEEEGLTNRHPEFDPTAYISLSDGTGLVRWGVSVHHEGEVEVSVVEPTAATANTQEQAT